MCEAKKKSSFLPPLTSIRSLKRRTFFDNKPVESSKMQRRNLLAGLLVISLVFGIQSSSGAGAGNGRSKVLDRGRLYNARMPIIIPSQRNINYYEHKDAARIIQASHFELDYMLGRKITFFCMAQGLPRPEITWFKDGIELYAHRYFQVHEWPLGNDTMKSKMEIDPTTQQDAGYYECQADNPYSIDRRGFRTDYVLFSY